ncbi:hypothetical protein VB780_19245 [Leptolyngbya sp. CCNP1308]|uniref:hypothetical protein n=1 Tax=Leptolyngbya sp. CCNP1308 TaxID=3110255 RepID=UPI002B1F6B3C|nr:hypothetical protein [Leptolyngbya sp. CCNP1308]MEA5450724.1 hypothetical protein [Leptolyngbya sp. CCNP1308]
MTSKYSNDRRRGSFIRWSARSRSSDQRDRPDPEFVVDRRQLYKYLDSLEGLSGE